MSYLEEKGTYIGEINQKDKGPIVNKKLSHREMASSERIDKIDPEDNRKNGKERLKLIMKLVGILLSTIIIPIILSAYQEQTSQWVHHLFADNKTKKPPITPNQGKLQSVDEILIKLNQLAHNGRIINCDFSLGTSKQELLQKWGNSTDQSKNGLIEYWNYKERHITLGVYKNRLIDIRSFDPLLQKLTLGQVKESGKPDKEYDHMNLDQHFIVYHMGNYKLRMVFPKPTINDPSPHLINISLVDINYSN